jgi:flavin reductase (DIM6/NTAB) family NADH-FMN oxidoreductase RutF
MGKREISYNARAIETLETMKQMGLLLVTADSQGKPNAMAIGWGSLGVIWRHPIFTVLVRVSRYTHQLLENFGHFTVNVPPLSLQEVVLDCGTRSGREVDKFAAHGLTAVPGQKILVPIIEQCIGHYECRVVYRTHIARSFLDPALHDNCYPKGDYHTVYYGQILAAYWES